jgi:hypothetical protein
MEERIHTIGQMATEGAGRDAMNCQWVSMERYRLDVVRGWPPSAYKEATVAAIYSSLASLGCGQSTSVEQPTSKTSGIHVVPDAPLTKHLLPFAA